MIKAMLTGKSQHSFLLRKKNSPSVLKYLLQYETVFKKERGRRNWHILGGFIGK